MTSKLITSLPITFIKQGECHFSNKPELVITILGSCLSIVMYSLEKRMSAISHCVMPTRSGYSSEADTNDFRYVDTSIKRMLCKFEEQKVLKSKLYIKIFGGAEQLPNEKKKTPAVGKQNIIMALKMLDEEGLNVISMDVGGSNGRKIYVSSHTGEVLLSRLGDYKIVRLDKVK